MCKFASCFPPCNPHPYRPCKTRRATESGRAYTEASHKHSLGRENGATRSTCRYSDEDLPYSWEILFLLCMRRYYEMGSYLIKHYTKECYMLKELISRKGARGGIQRGTITKYQPFAPIDLPDRQWPSRTITSAPIWCSVELRDGNQVLPIPMGIKEKLEMFQLLVEIGFKEIEVGFPASSQIEFDFVRLLIEEQHIPGDVTIQALVQARDELITRTFESLRGAKKAIVHLYNSTSPLQRRVVFGLEKPDIINIATRGAKLVKELVATLPGTQVIMQYSPESFSSTEIDFAFEICKAGVDVGHPTPENKIIRTLPVPVQVATPNNHTVHIKCCSRHLL